MVKNACIFFLLICSVHSLAQKQQAIFSGVPWFDDRGKAVSAHGANIIKERGRYYLFGEAHTDSSNAFAGFNCYASADLYNWKFESVALPVQASGRLGPGRVGERPKVLKCPATGEYVMLMHTDSLGYRDPCIGYATSRTVTGPYVFRGPLLFNGAPIKKWDMGSFQDSDGSGYLLVHSGNIYKLSNDYHSIAEQTVKDMEPEGESPAMFKKDGMYYWLASHRTSWERNDNFYYTATSVKGPWTNRGLFAPQGSLTWNSQATFVLPVEGAQGTTYMFMGDRWAFPHQASAATYVWQPLTVSGTALSIPAYWEAWQISSRTGLASRAAVPGTVLKGAGRIAYSGQWEHADPVHGSSSDAKGAALSVTFTGTQIGFYSLAGPNGGFAGISISNSKGHKVLMAMADMYSKYPVSALKFLSPVLPKGRYTLTITVLGERGNWSDKKGTVYGSKGHVVSVGKIMVAD